MKRLNLVFSIFAVALMLSLFGCSGASDNTTVEPTPTPTPAASSSAVFISKWGTQGTGDGQFANPRGVAVASEVLAGAVAANAVAFPTTGTTNLGPKKFVTIS